MWLCRAQCVYWGIWAWHPPVGVWIGVLGLLGVIVPLIRDINKIGRREKAAWTFIMFWLLLLEMKSVYQDRNEHDIQQAKDRVREENNFQSIANGIQGSIADSARNFTATMGETNEVLENITGGRSFAIVTPQVWSGLVPIPLSIRNFGSRTLTGVTVTILHSRDWDVQNLRTFYETHIVQVGTLHPGELRLLKETLTPVEGSGKAEDGSPADAFDLSIAAQNFTAQEHLVFKKAIRIPWAFKYTVTRQYIKSKHGGTITFGYRTLASQNDWVGAK
jgi:hypothetical protein